MSFDSLGKSFSVRRGEKAYVRADSWARGCGEGGGRGSLTSLELVKNLLSKMEDGDAGCQS